MEAAKPLEALIAEKAKQRMSEGGKGTSFEAPLIVAKEVAKQIGVSSATRRPASTRPTILRSYPLSRGP